MGLWFDDFTLAISTDAEAEARSVAAAVGANAEINAAVAAAAARLEEAATINTVLLGPNPLAEDAYQLQSAFQPVETPKASRASDEVQQQAPIRRITLRMPMAPLDDMAEEATGPAALEEQTREVGELDGTQTAANMEPYVDIAPDLTKDDIIPIDWYFPRSFNKKERLH
ncbi:hypothetical protein NCC49_004829 [Naganishia albida]|nr:hypothetical protein NCC49_004829 [Naganishia albida]